MSGVSLELNSVCPCGHEDATHPYWSVNADLHLIHVLDGGMHLWWAGRKHRVEREHVIYIPPLTEYGIAALQNGLSMLNFHFRFQIDGKVPFEERYRFPLIFSVADFRAVRDRLERMTAAWKRGDLAGSTRAAGLACEIVGEYLETQPLIEGERNVDREMAELRQALADDESAWFAAAQWADFVSLSVSQMNRRFQKAFRTTPRKFWESCRLNRVRHMLGRSTLPVGVIAAKCGMQDANYFSRWFKTVAGVSPTEYRRNAAQI